MAAHAALAVLLMLISTFYGSEGADPQCDILNSTTNSSNSAFNLTVSPETLTENTNYSVSVQGSGNYTVILQALSTSGAVGNWSNGNISCNGSPLFLNAFENGNRLQAQWRSPASLTSVKISAHIKNANETFVVNRTLSQAAPVPTTPPAATTAPVGNSTSSINSTSSTNTTSSVPSSTITTKATTIQKTTGGGCTAQAGLLTVALLGLLAIVS